MESLPPDPQTRDTSVAVVRLEPSMEVYIVVSLSTRSDTQVIYVDPTTGALRYHGRPGYDIFYSQKEAIDFITEGLKWPYKTIYARAILGYASLGSMALLLVAKTVSATVENLPGGGCIYTVTESDFVRIPLFNPQPQGKGEVKNIQDLAEIDIDGKHYYCETRDITRPFPSRMPLMNPDEEFFWNGWLSKPFKDIGLPQHCVILLQGFAGCRIFGDSSNQAWAVALIARRSRLHPGTRYLARGINSCFGTGNEVECEQLVWTVRNTRQNAHFSTYIWRRGTIPIWWGAELKLTAAEAEIYVDSRDPYKGSLQYYQRLSMRYGTPGGDASAVSKKKKPTPIVCINLLRNGEGKSESILVEHFAKSLNFIRASGKLLNSLLLLINYDWHASVKARGEQVTVEGLWKQLKNPTVNVGFNEGSYFYSKRSLQGCKGLIIPNDNFGGDFCLRSLQNGVIRFNCADSLDRTNAASYFGALQVFVEQCRRLGINLGQDSAVSFSSSFNYSEPSSIGPYIGSLPHGWEERSDSVTGKLFYVNHITKTTTWEHPCPDKPWKRFDMTFDQFKSSTMLSPVNQLAELFLLAGDIHATLYTGSKAMHSQILNIFNNETGKFKQFSAAQNVKITLQRRYQNVVVDSSRQKQLEMFLGIRLFKHLPSLSVHPPQVLSRPLACLLKPISHMFPTASGEPNLLSFKQKSATWVCSPATDVVELFIFLGEPCHVCQLLVTVSGQDNLSEGKFAGRVDVRTGCDLDGLKLVLEGAFIPQSLNGSTISIPLLGAVHEEDLAITGTRARLQAEESYSSLLYDFEELEGEINFLTRIVALTFYPSVPGSTPISLGEVEVLGVSLPWLDIFSNKAVGSKLIDHIQKLPKDSITSRSDFSQSTDPFLCSSDSTPSFSSREQMQNISREKSGSFDLLDLLSGDSRLPHSVLQTEASESVAMDFFEKPTINHSRSEWDLDQPDSPLESSVTSTGVQYYMKCLRYFSHKGYKLSFLEAMKLEIERLHANLSAAERDRALLSASIIPEALDPNLLLDDADLSAVCKYAKIVSHLAHVAFEDKIISSIGLGNLDTDDIDFWNVDGFGENCYESYCEVGAVQQMSSELPSRVSSTGPSSLVCTYCDRRVCKVCCTGRGALLLASYLEKKRSHGSLGQTGSSHGSRSGGTSCAEKTLCKLCCDDEVIYALYVDHIRVLSSLRRRSRADSAAKESIKHVLGSLDNITDTLKGIPAKKKQLARLLGREESLAEFPFAGLLHEVETAFGSEPPLSLLAPVGAGSSFSYWRAPASSTKVELSIVLGGVSDVSGVMLLVSSCGYSEGDCPIVQIWASNKINREERSCMGKWDVKSLLASSGELYGPESDSTMGQVPRHVKFLFKNPVRCRIIWIMLSLPQAASSPRNVDGEFNLLSLDENENPFAQTERLPSFSGNVTNKRCLHAKRIVVFGSALKREPIAASDKIMRPLTEKSPLGRFKVPMEAERLTGNDLILEQYLLPSSPGVAGFRFDALNVIRPRVRHSPCSSDGDILQSSLTCLEDRHINPAVLYIHVSVSQDPMKAVTLGEYRLPEARVGTPLYFDFPQPVQARLITFKLLGDISAFADDPTESGESDIQVSSLASGLSLLNRIKLYYYGNSYEMGKLATLSAV